MTYQTKSGDMFDLVAFNLYGDCRFVQDLMIANRPHLQTFIFSAGKLLDAPTVDRKTKVKTPPWKSS